MAACVVTPAVCRVTRRTRPVGRQGVCAAQSAAAGLRITPQTQTLRVASIRSQQPEARAAGRASLV
jgi:hypothetical protein